MCFASAHADQVHAVSLHDALPIFTASGDQTARIWDAATGAEIAVLRGHKDQVSAAAFSPDGSRIVTASGDQTARIDRKSTRLNSSHVRISYAVFCLKKNSTSGAPI